ncbi:hypothetical protein QQF64_032503 [Cirrhinus molitorella]|uniref:Rho-GAP domain-containing protein n=1 Tax=Cirrhinus molitorella TaxID=172907 RepID=A0ABR3N009_9TELE
MRVFSSCPGKGKPRKCRLAQLLPSDLCEVDTPRAVFGFPLISLRKSGQMRQGLPLVLTHTVEFLEKHYSKEEELNQLVRTTLNSLSEEHFNVLCYVMFFLSRVAAESHLNRMTSENLAIVFGPTIFHFPLCTTASIPRLPDVCIEYVRMLQWPKDKPLQVCSDFNAVNTSQAINLLKFLLLVYKQL